MKITARQISIPLTITFKQASFTRTESESILVTVSRDNHIGIGEGCPRCYSTGEDVISGLKWIDLQLANINRVVNDLTGLKAYINAHSKLIDQHPAAWCAIETALLDLFAREKKCSVEQLLGLANSNSIFKYSAILGDSDLSKFNATIQQYLKWGFSDFKIKLSGDLQGDTAKIKSLKNLCDNAGRKEFTLRLDANNLWRDDVTKAVNQLQQLPKEFMAVEEPFTPKIPEANNAVSTAINLPVILDESLTTITDLQPYESLDGQFIANLKVSRIGGVIRGLALIEELKRLDWKIIIGAHVGESSILTRAAMCLANAAGDQLIGHEGGFGSLLLKKDPVYPSLQFGPGGILDLSKPVNIKNGKDELVFSPEHWNLGWGLDLNRIDY